MGAALAALAEQNIQMIYTTVYQVLAQGDYVLAVSGGTFGGVPTSYYNLWRVENGKIAEHWDVMETAAITYTVCKTAAAGHIISPCNSGFLLLIFLKNFRIDK